VLDIGIQLCLYVFEQLIRDNRAVSQGLWSDLHPSQVPFDDPAGEYQVGGCPSDVRVMLHFEFAIR
jgi:hypothetical protein